MEFIFICLHRFHPCHTVKWPAKAKPPGPSLCMHAQEIREHHHERWTVLLLLCTLLVCSSALLTCFLAVTPLGSCVHIFRMVVSVQDMEIVQSAEVTGSVIGSPTPYKGEGTATVSVSLMLEVIRNCRHGSFWCWFSLQGICQLNRKWPHPLPPPRHLVHSKPLHSIQNLDLHKDQIAVSSRSSRISFGTDFKFDAKKLLEAEAGEI